MRKKTPSVIVVAAAVMMLAGCAAPSSGVKVGPRIDPPEGTQASPYLGVRLDVIVPVFDPGIPDDPDDYAEQGVWPELRRTEANRFALSLKNELQDTNVFGDIHVMPTTDATGDLYVIGGITQSNGEDLEIEVEVVDIAGNQWMKRSYEHRVREYFWDDLRNKGRDPYQTVFKQVAEDVADMIRRHEEQDLATLRRITEIRFARTFSEEAFSEYIQEEDGRVTLTALPDRNDPMLNRTRAIRVQDGLFMDGLQAHHAAFVQRTDESYAAWQEYAMVEVKNKREAERAAFWQRVAGIGLSVLGAAAVLGGVIADSPGGDAAAIGGLASVVGGIVLLEQSFKNSAEGAVHADALVELGQSLNVEAAPQLVELEGKTAELTGDANEQFRQWRTFLRKIYDEEGIPDTKI